MRERRQVGWFVVTEAQERTKYYECAAWYTIVKVEPGRYPVTATVEDGKILDYPGLTVAMSGTIVEDYFQSLWCGSRVGAAYDRKQNAGNPDTFSFSPYAHSVAAAMLAEGESSPWQLEGFKPQRVEFTYDGKLCETHQIVAI